MSSLRQSALCQPKPPVHGYWVRQQFGYGETWKSDSEDRRKLFVGETHGAEYSGHSEQFGTPVYFGGTLRGISVAYISNQEWGSKSLGVCKGLTLKLGELLENPNRWCCGQSAAKPGNRNVQRLSLRGVRSSERKRLASKDEDIVWTVWKHAAALKGGVRVTTLREHLDGQLILSVNR